VSKLKKELKLFELFSIASGAMISSGLFILPGLAYAKSGTMVIAAYFIAGLLVLPTIFSKAELSTAMPRSGGTYYFVGRSLGNAFGTLAGISAWFSLSFKSAFALLGIGAFASILFPGISYWQIKLIAIGFCLLFTTINLFSVHHSGKIQTYMVIFLIALLAMFVVFGAKSIQLENYAIHQTINFHNVFMTAGMIFISFGGVTKIVDLAEEITNPKRNIPLAMFLSFFVVNSIYVAVIFVTVGLLGGKLGGADHYSITPISDAANVFWGTPGKIILGIAALLAFISTANAGIMAASRTPMAMSRDKILPNFFNTIHPKYHTPQNSIFFTSGFMILVILLPLDILVKTASTIMIILFTFENLSLIIMRESNLQNYHPKFKSPLYPWVQIIAIVAYVTIISQMGKIPLLISGIIMSLGLIWYWLFGRVNENRESALLHIVAKVFDRKLATQFLESELKTIIRERDDIKLDKFDKIIEDCLVLDLQEHMDKDSFFKLVAEKFSQKLPYDSDDIFEKIKNREEQYSTVLSENIAIPHIIIDGKGIFEVMLVRAKNGISFTEEADNIQIVFVIMGTMDQRTFHLKALAALAQVIQNKGFEENWLNAKSETALRDIILLGERRR